MSQEIFTNSQIDEMAKKLAEIDELNKFIAFREKQIIENEEEIKDVLKTVQEVLDRGVCRHKIPQLQKMMNDQIKKIRKETELFKIQIINTKKYLNN